MMDRFRVLRKSRAVRRPRRACSPSVLESLEGRLVLSGYGSAWYPPAPANTGNVATHPVLHPRAHALKPHGQAAAAAAVRGRHTPPTPADPAIVGSWTPPVKFKPAGAHGAFLAAHTTLLPNGKVLAWPHDYNYFLSTKHAAKWTPNILLWDPATNQYSSTNLPTSNLFCSGHTFLPDGELNVLGGHGPAAVPVSGLQTAYGQNHAELYDYRTNSWSAAQNMGAGRYYGSAITLGTGEVLVLAGYTEQGYNNASIEIFKQGQGWRTLTGASTNAYPDWYPQIYQLSNGLVYGSNPGSRTFFLDPSGNGRIWSGPSMNYPRRYYGTSVMYDQDKIISIGGNAAPGRAGTGSNRLITNTAETIDLASPNPTWHYTGSMKYARFFPSSTLLPDGTVLVTGGTREQSNNNGNALRGAVYAAELWNPQTGQWSELSSMKVPRMYHSTAILLPDARVLVAGGGEPESTGEAKGTIHDNMQIFSPPYLFRGPQPVISSAPDTAQYGQTIDVASPQAGSITKVNLVRLGSITHGFNMTQRIIHASLSHSSDNALTVQMPTNPNAAPPGFYMLFLLNDLGVPSQAKIFQLTS
jgi:galactose oxidase